MFVFTQRLKRVREDRHLTQSELAVKAELPAASISHYERGARMPGCRHLCQLADALGVTTDFLLGRGSNELEQIDTTILYNRIQDLTNIDRGFVTTLVWRLTRTSETTRKD